MLPTYLQNNEGIDQGSGLLRWNVSIEALSSFLWSSRPSFCPLISFLSDKNRSIKC